MKYADTSVIGILRAPLFRPLRSLAVSLFGWIGPLACVLVIVGIAVGNAPAAHASVPADTLYGGGSQRIVMVDQNDGSITPLAPQPDFLFLALAFDSVGRLFAAGCDESSSVSCDLFSDHLLMELDPLTGKIVDTIGPVTDVSGSQLRITALSMQPETDVLFGFSVNLGADSARIWTIDKSTEIATLVAPRVPAGCLRNINCSVLGEFAFGPDGTLYHITVDGFSAVLMTLDPSTGAELTSVPIQASHYVGLAVRSDGVIFSTTFFIESRGDPYSIVLMTIDPLTGAVTQVGIGEDEEAVLSLDFSRVAIKSVNIDIKPGGDPNSINPFLEGLLPVAILGSETFDVADVDATTLVFGPDGARLAHYRGPHFEDPDGDGLTDLLGHFRIEETGIEFGDMEGCLTGETLDGTSFEGCDAIRTVPDMDGDGLLDLDEAAIGTDDLNPDTDGDGYTDGQEVHLMGTDPLNGKDPKPAHGRKRRGMRNR